MRAKILLGLCITLLLIASSASAVISAPSLAAVLTSQSPYPAEPGKNIDIEVEFQNNGLSDGENILVEIVIKDPFTLLPGQDEVKTFNKIAAKSSVKATYTLFVAEDAITGSYNLEFRIHENEITENYATKKVTLSVQGNPELILSDLSSTGNAEPGGELELVAKVKNIGTGTARQLKLDFSSTAEFIPILAGGSIFMGDLGPNEEKEATLVISIDSSAEHKTYTASLTASYLDEASVSQSKTFSTGIPVTGTVSLDVINVDADFARNRITIEVANKGTTDAAALEARLMVDGELVDVEYISTLKATKKTTLSYPLTLNGGAVLEITYRGPGLETNTITKDITLDFDTPGADNTGTYAVIVIVVIIVAYFIWRRSKKKK